MDTKTIESLQEHIHKTHRMFQKAVEELNEEQLCWLPSALAPPVRWHLWHVARCVDFAATTFTLSVGASNAEAKSHQIWYRENLKAAWGLTSEQMGHRELGTRLENAVAVGIP